MVYCIFQIVSSFSVINQAREYHWKMTRTTPEYLSKTCITVTQQIFHISLHYFKRFLMLLLCYTHFRYSQQCTISFSCSLKSNGLAIILNPPVRCNVCDKISFVHHFCAAYWQSNLISSTYRFCWRPTLIVWGGSVRYRINCYCQSGVSISRLTAIYRYRSPSI